MSEQRIEKTFEVEISGTRYLFSRDIGGDQALLKSFNELAKQSFGLSFDCVGGEYEPHVLSLEGMVCANVSVNQIPFIYKGERRFYIQLGTVMTHEEFRNRGLSRWLMEAVLKLWKEQCDAVYLFANDTVLDFYPKFGFVKTPEYEYRAAGVAPKPSDFRRLDFNDKSDRRLAEQKYAEGNPFSAFYMAENQAIFSFYCNGGIGGNFYYSPSYDLVAVAEERKNATILFDVFGKTKAKLRELLGAVPAGAAGEIILGFTPLNPEGFLCQRHHEEDTTLFVSKDGENIFRKERLMFPVLSHA